MGYKSVVTRKVATVAREAEKRRLFTSSIQNGRRQFPTAEGWVTKTDVVRYFRCPYAYWLTYKGELRFQETVPASVYELLDGGVEFERTVEERAAPVEIPATQFLEVLGQDVELFRPPTMVNELLKLYGRPDVIRTSKGNLLPVEIKSHKNIQRLDVLELAFYWRLLEPYRTASDTEPCGYLILRRDGQPTQVEVSIPRHRLDEVDQLIEDVRRARYEGVKLQICGCQACRYLKRDTVQAAADGSVKGIDTS